MYCSEPSFQRAAGLRKLAARQLALPESAGTQQAYLLLQAACRLELEQAFTLCAASTLELNSWCSALAQAAAAVCPLPPSGLQVHASPVPLPVAGRASVLTAAVLQLIGNSLRYAGPRPALQLHLQAAGSCALLFYKDNGPGPAVNLQPGFGFLAARALACQAGGSFLVRMGGPGFCCGFSLPLCHDLPGALAPGVSELVADRFSPLYLHLCPSCILPD